MKGKNNKTKKRRNNLGAIKGEAGNQIGASQAERKKCFILMTLDKPLICSMFF